MKLQRARQLPKKLPGHPLLTKVRNIGLALFAPVLMLAGVQAAQNPVLTWTNPASISYGTPLSSTQLNASADVPGSFDYNPASGTTLPAGTNTLSVVFTPNNNVQYNNATGAVQLIVAPSLLRVTAANKSRGFGQPNPTFTGSISGVQNGDNISASYSTDATITSPPGSYSILPTLIDPDHRLRNYAVNTVKGVLRINDPPVITSGPTNQSVILGCGATFTVSATGTNLAYQWQFQSADVPGATNDTLILNSVTLANDGDYQVVVTNSDGAVTSTPPAHLSVLPPPPIFCPSNLFVNCLADVPDPDTNAVGNPNGVIVSYVGDVPVTSGCQIQITRTYSGLNSCGSSSICQQTITVMNTNPPVMACAPDRTVECGTIWDFDSASATEFCTGLSLPVSLDEAGTNYVVGNTFVARRTWRATDSCSNSATCTQTITVVDTTRPQITCPAKINAAEAPRGSNHAIVNFPAATAVDSCDPNPVVTSLPLSGSLFQVGSNTVTCTAVDVSGNSNTCSFIVRVIPYRLVVTSADDAGPGTLREALLDANDAPGENLIVFDLPGPAPHIIQLLSALPEITSPLILDGWPTGISNVPPVIELDGGGGASPFDGLVIPAGLSSVRGLALHGFATAIRLDGAGGNTIQGNFIGPDSTGTNAPGNANDGLYVTSDHNTIGGIIPGQGNLISANGGNGIHFATGGASDNVVRGNLIGVAGDGVSAMGNGADGIFLSDQPFHNLIGGAGFGSANTIAFNGSNGVALASSAGLRNGISANSIFSNGGLGIDLGADGVTPNDGDDSDTGPNALQNFPVLQDAQSADGTTSIFGELTSTPNMTYRIEFFLNDTADPSGYGEGKQFIGATSVTVHGNGPESFSAAFPLTALYTQFITATATDPANNTSEFSAAVQVRTPPVIDSQPVSTNAPAGTEVTFCANASGTPPLFYQWLFNGFIIPGATNSCYTVPSDVTNGGSYSVEVGNELGALGTVSASLTLPLTQLAAGDNFADRVPISGLSGTIAGNNLNATREVGEPRHAGKTGGKSVWYTWQAPVTGVATFRTVGSTFDTLLAIYSGTVLSNLVTIDSDEDAGGHGTSRTHFNVIHGNQYHIAIDGFDGVAGEFILGWDVEDTPHLLPAFRTQPVDQVVAPGSNATFTAVAVRVCGNGHEDCPDPGHYPEDELPNLYYQWYFQNQPIPGATESSLTISNVQPGNVGTYKIIVSTLWQSAESDEALLQINLTGNEVQNVHSFSKFGDAEEGDALVLGVSSGTSIAAKTDGFAPAAAVSAVVSGYTGTQIFNTTNSSGGPICGVIGGSSQWINLVTVESGTLFINTDGSSFDTVVAVFQRPAGQLVLVGCNNNGGTNGKTSALSVPVVNGQTNFIQVDGVNGASGTLYFNYSLVPPATLKALGTTDQGAHLQVFGRTNMHFVLQASSNLVNWSSILTSSLPIQTPSPPGSVLAHIDGGAANLPLRYYRALLLP